MATPHRQLLSLLFGWARKDCFFTAFHPPSLFDSIFKRNQEFVNCSPSHTKVHRECQQFYLRGIQKRLFCYCYIYIICPLSIKIKKLFMSWVFFTVLKFSVVPECPSYFLWYMNNPHYRHANKWTRNKNINMFLWLSGFRWLWSLCDVTNCTLLSVNCWDESSVFWGAVFFPAGKTGSCGYVLGGHASWLFCLFLLPPPSNKFITLAHRCCCSVCVLLWPRHP